MKSLKDRRAMAAEVKKESSTIAFLSNLMTGFAVLGIGFIVFGDKILGI
jgi:hypothetical protein